MLKMVDQAIIKVLQESYNRVWDYTGLTKGMIKIFIQSFFLLFAVLYNSGFSIIYLLVLITGVYSIYKNIQSHENQIRGKFQIINKLAEEEQSEVLCVFFRLPLAIFTLLYLFFITDLVVFCIFTLFMGLMLLYFYMSCLYVRDREPPGKYNHAFGSL